MNKKKVIKIIIAVVLVTFFAVSNAFIVGNFYVAKDIDEYLVNGNGVSVTKSETGYFYDGNGTDDLLIFYPGAYVDCEAYGKIMFNLAKSGIDVYVLDVPLDVALFSKNMATSIINKYEYDNYYVGGHSLGGVVATEYANKHNDVVKGIVLLASYPNEKVDNDLKLISIYGSNDGVLKMSKYKKAKKNYWPNNAYELVIDGGNHAGFANYGKQKHDNDADISSDSIQEQTINFIVKYIKED